MPRNRKRRRKPQCKPRKVAQDLCKQMMDIYYHPLVVNEVEEDITLLDIFNKVGAYDPITFELNKNTIKALPKMIKIAVMMRKQLIVSSAEAKDNPDKELCELPEVKELFRVAIEECGIIGFYTMQLTQEGPSKSPLFIRDYIEEQRQSSINVAYGTRITGLDVPVDKYALELDTMKVQRGLELSLTVYNKLVDEISSTTRKTVRGIEYTFE